MELTKDDLMGFLPWTMLGTAIASLFSDQWHAFAIVFGLEVSIYLILVERERRKKK